MNNKKNETQFKKGAGLTKKERYDLKKQEKQAVLQKLEKQRKAKRFLFWGVALLVVGVSIWGMVRVAIRTAPNYAQKPVDAVSEADWVKGNSQAGVTLIEYGDFQCPACASYFPIVKQLGEEFSENLRIVYRHFPLRSIHPKAQLAGQAAEAAGLQGKFWEMHDLLYERQAEWVNGKHKDLFIQYAEELELDIDKFKEDTEGDFAEDKVNGDYISANAAGLTGTPSFFLNGERIPNPRGYDNFKALILELLPEV